MFIGRYYHTLESGGRVSLPKDFRANNSEWIITRGLDGGLFIFTQAGFDQQIGQLADRTFTKQLHRDFFRLMVNDAHAVSPDKNGRINIPDHLQTLAGIQKEVVVVGSYNYLELWDVQKYHQYLDTIGDQATQISEQIENNQT